MREEPYDETDRCLNVHSSVCTCLLRAAVNLIRGFSSKPRNTNVCSISFSFSIVDRISHTARPFRQPVPAEISVLYKLVAPRRPRRGFLRAILRWNLLHDQFRM